MKERILAVREKLLLQVNSYRAQIKVANRALAGLASHETEQRDRLERIVQGNRYHIEMLADVIADIEKAASH